MTTMEKLFVEIFERKKRIIDQVKHQTDIFDHYLASKCLLDGFTPPPCLFSSSSSSVPNQLKKEELISEILLPRPQPANLYSSNLYTMCTKPVVAADNVGLPSGLYTQVHDLNRGVDAGDRLSVLPQLPTSDAQGALNGVPELDCTVKSPLDCKGARIPDCGPDLSVSLVRIQRSKSRQRALELRNSAKAAKNGLCDESNVGASTGQIVTSGITSLQYDHADDPELVKPVDANGESCQKEEEKVGECKAMENCDDIYHGGTMASQSSGQRITSVSKPGNFGNSSYIAKDNGLTQSIDRLIQQSNHINELPELVNPSSVIANANRPAEEATIGECRGKEMGINVYSGRIARSRSYNSQSSSPKEPLDMGKSSCVAEEDSRARECIDRSVQLPHRVNELSDPDNTLLVIANATCAAEEAITGECQGKEIGSNIFSRRTTGSRSYNPQPSSGKGPLDVGRSSCVAKEDSRAREYIDRSAQQPDYVNELSELVNPSSVIANATGAAEEASMCEWGGKEMDSNTYSGRITRSRSCIPQPSSVKGPLDVGNTSCILKEDSRHRESTERSAWQPNCVNESLELVKSSSVTSNGSYGVSKAKIGDMQSKEKGSDIYFGKITRSRSSNQQANWVNKCLKLNSSCVNSKESDASKPRQHSNCGDDLRELVKPCDITDENCQVIAKVRDCQSNEGGIDAYCGRITRSRSSGQQLNDVNGLPEVDGSTNIAKDDDGTLSESFGKSSQQPQHLILVGGKRVDQHEAFDAGANALPCAMSSDNFDLEKCDDVVVETDADSDGLVEACSGTSGSNIDGTSHGVEALVSRTPRECAMFVKPKQLDFDDVEECGLNETSDPSLENKQQGISSEKQPSTLAHSTGILDNVASVDCQEKPNSSMEMPLLKEQELSINEPKDSSKACEKDHAEFVDEFTINSVRLKMTSAISQSQNAESYFMGSSPQHKRIKIGGQLVNAFWASPSLMINPSQPIYPDHVVDAVQSDVGQSPVEEMNKNEEHCIIERFEFSSPRMPVEKDEPSFEGSDRTENSALMLMHEQLGAPPVSSLTKLATQVSQCSLLEKAEVADPTGIVFGAIGQQTAEENQVLLQLESRFELENTDLLTDAEKPMQVRKSHTGGNDNLPCCSVGYPHSRSVDMIGAFRNMPEFEGFVMETDDEQPHVAEEEINFEKLELPNAVLERASVLERLCKSACLHTPLSHFSTTYKLHKTHNLNQSIPNGLLEGMELRSTLNVDSENFKQLEPSYNCLNGEANHMLHARAHSDGHLFSNAPSAWDIRKPYLSPVGQLWDGITYKSGSSGKRASSIPELPCISEENENAEEVVVTYQEGIDSEVMNRSVKRGPLADITKDSNLPTSVCESGTLGDRQSFASVNTEFSVTGTCNRAKLKLGNLNNNKTRHTSKAKGSQSIAVGVKGVQRANESLQNRFSKPKLSGKTSLRKGGPSQPARESKPNNIVSNITSFIPLVQQRQAAAIVTGKRDIKVKALEAAEAAKRFAEKKENERKIRKEALKLERARIEEQNLRQLELEREKKEEEWKKKQADMAAKKRQREEEERKEKERKKKRVEEGRRQQVEREEKLRAEKEEKEIKCQAADERACQRKGSEVKSGKNEKMEKAKENNNLQKVPETEPTTNRVSIIDPGKASFVPKDSETLSDFVDSLKAKGNNFISDRSQEQSYEISPYKGSDDEDEDDEDDIPNSKFIPSWASKNCVVLAISSQQKIDPESIFSPESFCNIAEVLLPRKLQQK